MGDPNDPKPAEKTGIPPISAFDIACTVTQYGPTMDVPSAAPLRLLPPMLPSHYILGKPIGVGGMGMVVRVTDPILGRMLALKVVMGASQDLVTRFILEAKVTAQAQHPNVIYLIELVRLPENLVQLLGGEFAMLLPFFEGQSLKDAFERQQHGEERWTIETFVHFLLDVISAVAYLHRELGVVHRDIKPGNIIVGKGNRGRLIDLGLVKVLALPDVAVPIDPLRVEPKNIGMTRTDQVMGTLAYMSPEQAASRPTGPASDVYSLGAVLYEGLTGRWPITFEGAGCDAVRLARILSQTPIRLCAINPDIPEELEVIVLRCLEKDPEKRYLTAEALETDLRAFLLHEKEGNAVRETLTAAIDPVQEFLDVTERVRELSFGLPKSQGIERKNMEEELSEFRRRRRQLFRVVEQLIVEALAHGGGRRKSDLASVFGRALEVAWIEAERERDVETIEDCRKWIETVNDGRYDGFLRAVGMLELDIRDDGVRVTIARYERQGRKNVLLPSQDLGVTPLSTQRFEFPWGDYRLTLTKEGYAPYVLPFSIDRSPRSIQSRLVSSKEVPPGFVLIPGTDEIGRPYVIGGDDKAPGCLPYEEVETKGFLVGIFPVTNEQWKEYLESIDPAVARPLLPRTIAKSDLPWVEQFVDEKIRFFPPEGVLLDQAVTRISWESAKAFTQWFTDRIGRPVRLLTQREWEIMASPLRWPYPWGEEWERGCCNDNRTVVPDGKKAPYLLPVGSFPDDTSPFGIRDLSGGVRDWCEDPPGDEGVYLRWRTRRGGACNEAGPSLRLQQRKGMDPTEATETDGFRLCIPF